ncbi:substrate-binding periplasmic protein [Azospirillum thermophilum]|uniref:ABC transporter substrate-binding protein n=1 Tax=Azospirillum thermophilum TaxID=2202148 RepID=A0A2S2CZ08_9PROT|nr:transporter substrate-binding domain-containing protein [Azospirillum thermophilum]AWK89698.1 ABC transporter substrate-binding protein [Azospirillum thermophilum]
MLTRRALLAGLAAGTALLPAAPRPGAARPLDDVMARGVLKVAVYRDLPPYSYRQDGEPAGIDVELARLLAGRLGVRLDLMEHTAGETVSDDLRVAVWRGYLVGGEPADVMLHIPYDRVFGQRNTEAVLFAPYQRERFALARNPERLSSEGVAALEDGDRIGVEIDTVPDFYMLSAGGGRFRERVVHFPSVGKAVDALLAGEVAGVLATMSELEGALKDRRADYPIAPAAMPGLPATGGWDIGMAVKENSRDLAYALTDIVTALDADGTLPALFARFGVTHTQPEANR